VFGTFLLQKHTTFVKGQRDLLNIDIEGSEIKRNYMPGDRESLYLKMWKISFSLLETLLLIALLAGKMAIGHRRGGEGGGGRVQQQTLLLVF